MEVKNIKEELFQEWEKFLAQYVEKMTADNEPDILGRLGFMLMDPKLDKTNKYNGIIFKGGDVKARLILNQINICRNIPDDLDSKSEEEIKAFVEDYFKKVQEDIIKEKN